jgi:hypothetical protein
MKKTALIHAELADREAIRDCLFRYSRAVDRRDAELLRSVYWPGAIDHHMVFDGPADEFVNWAMAHLSSMHQTMHLLSNMLIDIDGPFARVETYFVAYHKHPDGAGRSADNTVGGRYLDRMEKRSDEWRIVERSLALDWSTDYPQAGEWRSALPGITLKTNIWPGDASYELFADTSATRAAT